MFARALRWRVSADDKFLFVDTFELDPCAASAVGLVNRVTLFPDEAFEATTLHFIEKRFGLTANRSGVADSIIGAGRELFEHVLPRLQRQPDQAFAVELEQVECVEIKG